MSITHTDGTVTGRATTRPKKPTYAKRVGRLRPDGLKYLAELGKRHRLQCLAVEYTGVNADVEWRCQSKHTFFRSASEILRGRHCRHCGDSLGERITRAVFELALGVPFPTVRPPELEFEKGNPRSRLELDGFNRELGIAFEYDGDQHNTKKPIPFFTTGTAKTNQEERDRFKDERCKDWINLVRIPDLPGTGVDQRIIRIIAILNEKMPAHLRGCLGVMDTADFREVVKDRALSDARYRDLAAAAAEWNMELIDYDPGTDRARLRCLANAKHRERTTKAGNVRNHGCMQCKTAHKRLRPEDVVRRLEARGMVPLFAASEYENNTSVLRIMNHDCGHFDTQRYSRLVEDGYYCKACAEQAALVTRQRAMHKRAQEAATKWGGTVLSPAIAYRNNESLFELRPATGASFWISVKKLLVGQWDRTTKYARAAATKCAA
jgi:hypothetical protein